MRKFKHKITGEEFTTELLGCYKIEGIRWKDLDIPLWALEGSSNWQEVEKPKKINKRFTKKKYSIMDIIPIVNNWGMAEIDENDILNFLTKNENTKN